MQFGFNLPLSGPSASPAMLARLAAEGEAIGYDYAAISDHIVEPIDIHARLRSRWRRRRLGNVVGSHLAPATLGFVSRPLARRNGTIKPTYVRSVAHFRSSLSDLQRRLVAYLESRCIISLSGNWS